MHLARRVVRLVGRRHKWAAGRPAARPRVAVPPLVSQARTPMVSRVVNQDRTAVVQLAIRAVARPVPLAERPVQQGRAMAQPGRLVPPVVQPETAVMPLRRWAAEPPEAVHLVLVRQARQVPQAARVIQAVELQTAVVKRLPQAVGPAMVPTAPGRMARDPTAKGKVRRVRAAQLAAVLMARVAPTAKQATALP